ncbi:cation-translocating P-type ATPase [Thalassomonas actiniarum]|uniref:HAD-IC family P-type ATPase n=1 Tax=Thalassomonas actiniarum TaxID=485447 RepID=A0AAE9YHU8_9GAMM|nr:HAD-IC family P-type ATPase [Thalassomonas actiniarum]WDD96585.1 HAD-IC family P-type ATPase [Thalassomonas actiniarum]
MSTAFPEHLTADQAKQRLSKFGSNTLPEAKPPKLIGIFVRQFISPFIYVLFVAALVSFFLGQHINAFFIFAVLILNAVIGTIQEFSAEKAASALKEMVPSYAYVIRDNKVVKINSADLVVGDLVKLVSGDKIPADIRLCSHDDLQVDESMITGESMAVEKSLEPGCLVLEGDRQKAVNDTDDKGRDKPCFCYAGTVVMRGRGLGHVIATGENTEIGKIASDVGHEQTKPPLLLRIETFTLRITYGILLLIALIFIITLIRGDNLGSVFLLAVALAVSAIPEGLPAAITVALAIGMRRMARVKVIIRNLLAVEALGSCTYIASDKTGTLTVNEMTIKNICLTDNSRYQVSGQGLNPEGEISACEQGGKIARVELLVVAGLLANEAYLEQSPQGWSGQGDMVDVAFLLLAHKYGLDYQTTRKACPELGQIPYESENAYCASVNLYRGKNTVFVKGSVEKLLTMCAPEQAMAGVTAQANALAARGQRVLGLAYRQVDSIDGQLDQALHGLTFIGLVGMIDPLRPEVPDAIAECKQADINVAMITGDHPDTALALAREAGIADRKMLAVTGEQLAQAYRQGKSSFSLCIHGSNVFARVSPHQKKQIIDQLMHDGDFVAVTGDGVNDAPALTQAHVGIAMGLRGTDVARESADIILTDDNFASIVQGIRQGRVVYNNIRKVIFLLISTGAAEILLVLFSLLFSTPLPLFPLQLLWLNLVTNGIQDVALAFEPAEGNELRQQARPPDEAIFNPLMIERVLINALVMGTLAFSFFKWQLDAGVAEAQARNLTLLLMVLFENVHVLNSRSEHLSIFRQYFFGNKFLLFGMLAAQGIHIAAMYTPGLKDWLALSPVTLQQWTMLLLIASILIVVDEGHKLYHKRFLSASRENFL